MVGAGNEILFTEGSILDTAEWHTRHPRQKIALMRIFPVRTGHMGEKIAVHCRRDSGGWDALTIESRHPSQLRAQCRIGVIAASMHAQDVGGTAVYADREHGILSVLEQFQAGLVCKTPRRQRHPRDVRKFRAVPG